MASCPISTIVTAVLSVTAALVGPAIAQTTTVEYSHRSDVIYGRKFGVALTMEVFTPSKSNGLGVLWVVSSSGISSQEQTAQPGFDKRLYPFLSHGYTVFAVIHGSAPVFQIQDFVQDARRAVRYVRSRASEFRVDASRLGIAGSSAGGLLALLIAMHGDEGNPAANDPVDRASSRVQAAGSFFAPTELTNFGAQSESIVDLMQKRGDVNPSFQFYDTDPKSGARKPISDPQNVRRILGELSPITHVTPDDPPTILIHGDADKAIPIDQSRRLLDRLTASKVAARLVVREGRAHAWAGWEADTELIAQWFDTHLRKGV